MLLIRLSGDGRRRRRRRVAVGVGRVDLGAGIQSGLELGGLLGSGVMGLRLEGFSSIVVRRVRNWVRRNWK